jgi:hypothetical protein
MRFVCAVAGAALFACSLAGSAETKDPCRQSLDVPLSSRTLLSIQSRPAGLEIVGTDNNKLHVSCTAGNLDDADSVQLRFTPSSDGGRLAIEGTHLHHGNNNLEVKIEVPRRTNLRIRMGAGQVKVEEIKGDKDIDLYAGQITISSSHGWDYRSVNASVAVGEVRAPVFDADKGGFFRSLNRRFSTGEYRLHAHVTTGQIDIEGRKALSGEDRKPD